MKVAELAARATLAAALAAGLCYRAGPFWVRLRTRDASLADLFGTLYADADCDPGEPVVQFDVWVGATGGLRRWWRPQAQFYIDDVAPFEPYPLSQSFPLFEWGLNWCIAIRAHQYLMLHAAVVERDGAALILPAVPGSGKSTLCTGLAFRGWRLLSDEFGLVSLAHPAVVPLPRAIPLKNASIEVIRSFAPQACIGPVFPKTRKGDVAHVRPPHDSLLRQSESAQPRWILFPRFAPGVSARLQPLAQSMAFTRLSQNSFNYRLLGETGFRRLAELIRSCRCYSLDYGDLEAAVRIIDEVTRDGPRGGL